MSFEPSLPEWLQELSGIEQEDCAQRMAEWWRYGEDNWFLAFEGLEELKRRLFDNYEAK